MIPELDRLWLHILFAFVALLIVMSLASGRRSTSPGRCARAIAYIGVISYSTYLVHEAVMHLLRGAGVLPAAGSTVRVLVTAILVYTGSLLLSVVTYNLIELPGQRFMGFYDSKGKRREYYAQLEEPSVTPPAVDEAPAIADVGGARSSCSPAERCVTPVKCRRSSAWSDLEPHQRAGGHRRDLHLATQDRGCADLARIAAKRGHNCARAPTACEYSRMTREPELHAAIDLYFRALYACDVALLDSVFHPASTLFDVDEGAIVVDPYPAWREVVANRPSPKSVGQEREEEVVSVTWLSEQAATVHVRLRVLQAIFVDHLSFVDGPEGWRIVAKVWHLDKTL